MNNQYPPVKIKSKEWYNANKDSVGQVHLSHDMVMNGTMAELCGKTAGVTQKVKHYIKIDLDKGVWNWSVDMFE